MLLNRRISIIYFANLIKTDVIFITLYALLVSTLDHKWLFRNVTITLSISAIIGTLVSLLLAFRTSQAYERWWEARIIWGSIVNDSRTYIAKRQIIWCYALSESLRGLEYSEKVKSYLAEHNITGNNIPNAILDVHAVELAEISNHFQMDAIKQVQLDDTLVKLTDSMGRCERIKNTVFPKSYSVLVHFLIYVFLTIFPFGLSNVTAVMEMILTMLIPTLFITIEQTAIIMQDPFDNKPTDTPMTTISGIIERNLTEMVGEEPPAAPPVPATYFVM
jgi:ion channel-forming bestrophin family protein